MKLFNKLYWLCKFNPFISLLKGLLPQILKNFFLVVVIYCQLDISCQLREGLVKKLGWGKNERGRPPIWWGWSKIFLQYFLYINIWDIHNRNFLMVGIYYLMIDGIVEFFVYFY